MSYKRNLPVFLRPRFYYFLSLLALLLSFTRPCIGQPHPSIPVLDLLDYENPQSRVRFIRQLKNAAEGVGFFALLNFGIEDAKLQAVYRAAETFFKLDPAIKFSYCDRSLAGQRGFVDGETAKGKAHADYKQFFSVGLEKSHPNIWPKEVNLKQLLWPLFEEIAIKRKRIEEAFAEAIGQPKPFFSRMTQEGESLLRLLYYPPDPPEDTQWAAPHTDINLFSIFFRSPTKGLQLRTKEGEWIEVIVPEKAVIIGCGDMMENLTNGMFRSAVHRVRPAAPGTPRYSVVCFTHGRYSDAMDPLPACISMTGGKARYARATARELLDERLVDLGLATEEVMERLEKSGLMERLVQVGRASPKAIAALEERVTPNSINNSCD